MHGISSPKGFAEWLLDEDHYWPDSVPRPREEMIEVHPQGQVYIRFDNVDAPAELALYILSKIDRNSDLRGEVDTSSTIAVFEPMPECGEDGCHADAAGSKPYRDLCPAHGREEKERWITDGTAAGSHPEYKYGDGRGGQP